MELVGHYVDFFKDWIIVLVLHEHLDTTHFLSVDAQIVFIMTLLLVK